MRSSTTRSEYQLCALLEFSRSGAQRTHRHVDIGPYQHLIGATPAPPHSELARSAGQGRGQAERRRGQFHPCGNLP